MAYVLGYFAADGSMIKSKRSAYYVEFTTTDRILLENFKSATGVQNKISERSRSNIIWKSQYRIQVGSKTWFEDLTALGFTPNKSLTLVLPAIPAEFLGDFVRGYFDGDGCVYFKKHWSSWHKKEVWVFSSLFTSGARHFLEELHQVLLENGISGGHIAQKKRGYALVFSRHDSLALYDIMYNTGQVSGLFLPRKRDKFEEAIQTLSLRP
jgi:hypothetical protein